MLTRSQKRIFIILLIIFSFIVTRHSFANEQDKTINIAVLVYSNLNEANKYYSTMSSYLNKKLTGYAVNITMVKQEQLDDLIKNQSIDFFISNTVESIQTKVKYGSSELLTSWPIAFSDPSKAMGTAAVAKKDITFNSWQDLNRYNVVSTNKKAFGGYLIMAYDLSIKGINLQKQAKSFKFIDIPQEYLLQQVAKGNIDIALVPTCTIEHAVANGSIKQDSLKVIMRKNDFSPCEHSTDLFPYYSLSKLRVTDNVLSTKLVEALLEDNHYLQDHNQQQIKWIPPVDNSKVYALLQQLELEPFHTTWEVVKRYTHILSWIAVFLSLGLFYHFRTRALVTRRTKELSDEIKCHFDTKNKLSQEQYKFYKAQRILLTGEMASGISHELKQPLANIRYLAQGCQLRLNDKENEVNLALDKLILQVDRAQDTIKKLREFCEHPSKLEQINLIEVINEQLLLQHDLLKNFNIKVSMLHNEKPIYILGDTVLLQQVIANIINNSIDAMHSNIDKNITITLTQNKKNVVMEISDHGIGMTQNQIDRIFFPFETSKEHGLGLGMVICKRIIDEHNGKIWIENNHPGIKVFIKLPTIN